jgi:hypothetical protein
VEKGLSSVPTEIQHGSRRVGKMVQYTAEDIQGGFNNSLEMILWFYIEKEKARKGE